MNARLPAWTDAEASAFLGATLRAVDRPHTGSPACVHCHDLKAARRSLLGNEAAMARMVALRRDHARLLHGEFAGGAT